MINDELLNNITSMIEENSNRTTSDELFSDYTNPGIISDEYIDTDTDTDTDNDDDDDDDDDKTGHMYDETSSEYDSPSPFSNKGSTRSSSRNNSILNPSKYVMIMSRKCTTMVRRCLIIIIDRS
mmetsp:Transcript_32480/g.36338  ORF Transcript_32480/g.36338 Transcript_32480/m.36338 type:complete len:124 (-) Transcript_32480:177-548(-)